MNCGRLTFVLVLRLRCRLTEPVTPHRARLKLISPGFSSICGPVRGTSLNVVVFAQRLTPEITFSSISFSINVSASSRLQRPAWLPLPVSCNPFYKCQNLDKLSKPAAPTHPHPPHPRRLELIFLMVIILIGFLCPFHCD